MSSLTEEIKDIIILKNIYPFFDKEELKKKNYSSYWFGQEEIFIERLETLEKENIIDMEGKKNILQNILAGRYKKHSFYLNTIPTTFEIERNRCCGIGNGWNGKNSYSLMYFIIQFIKQTMDLLNDENTELFEYYLYILEIRLPSNIKGIHGDFIYNKYNKEGSYSTIDYVKFKQFKEFKKNIDKYLLIEKYYIEHFN